MATPTLARSPGSSGTPHFPLLLCPAVQLNHDFHALLHCITLFQRTEYPKRTSRVSLHLLHEEARPCPGLCLGIHWKNSPNSLWIQMLKISPPLLFLPSPHLQTGLAYPQTISIRLRGLASARMFTLGLLPGHNPSWGNTFLIRAMEKNYAKHLGFSVLPTSNSKELHQPPNLSKSEWLQGMGDRARLQGSWMPRRATDIFGLAEFLAKQKMSHLKAQRTNHTHHKLAIASGEPALSRPVSTGTKFLRQQPRSYRELPKGQHEFL